MRTLAALAEAGKLATIELRVLLLETATGAAREAAGTVALPFAMSEFRHLADRRILDAHEQMVLAPTVCWIGDCMRRDPSTRDAFETMTTTHRQATSYAQSSFGRLWDIASPLALPCNPDGKLAAEPAVVEDVIPPQAVEPPVDGAQTLSRH
jgi:hypothetical protein